MRRAPAALLGLLLALPAGAGIAVVDDTGAEVRLHEPARRIVTLAPHATELVFASTPRRRWCSWKGCCR